MIDQNLGISQKFPLHFICINSTISKFDLEKKEFDSIEQYPDAIVELPLDMPEPKGQKVKMICYVNSNHAYDTVT